MSNKFLRSEMLLGPEAMTKLNNSNVILFGLGGVGSYTAEALARGGVGNITLVDNDVVSESNINRQLCALDSTVGRYKTDIIEERIKDINPYCNVTKITKFYLPENADDFVLEGYDYVADAIDTVSAKIDIICRCNNLDIPVISCMGTGNKTDPSLFKISDIYETSVCPLCRVMRTELRKRNINNLNVLWSPEKPLNAVIKDDNNPHKNSPGSLSFVPGVAGLMIAGKIIMDLCR